ncbi:hypothetical protein ATCM_12360 [Stenotrophomonas sp. ATCM1_4]|nr:hypothetical protein ATCM_12360 [Stenotrophomonas sp. ATCM1_4]
MFQEWFPLKRQERLMSKVPGQEMALLPPGAQYGRGDLRQGRVQEIQICWYLRLRTRTIAFFIM